MSHTELKSLETRRRKVKEVLTIKKDEQQVLSREINQLIRNVKDIESNIQTLKAKKISINSITVTEHAILRYLERVEGVDIERVKKDIVDGETLKRIQTLGPGYYPRTVDEIPFRIRVKDNAVVTVLTGKTF